MVSHVHDDKKILNWVRCLQGQMNAVEQSLLNPETGCIQILQQVAAIKGAINGLMNESIETHLREHVIREATVNEEELAEFLKLLKRYG